ncbi:CaiB/BaiF CoA transferase family protein [Geodermatophilus sp. URMC 61]|uniref:CaiB/BaiF CoA transferase family protein n=1 Tax=Geodermatophilus sp. URMC 61 TaxID=3423411 RepID=UPI00406C8E32
MTGPLSGVRVVDLSRALAGPYATMMLADAGADVLKVEPPAGDDSRGWLPFVDRDGQRESAYFLAANRGKRSVRLDLKTEDGARRLRELCADADVLVENYRPGLMDRLGLGLETLRAANPRLVTLSITGFGSGGPDGHRAGFDQIVQAEAGLMSLTGAPEGEPTRVGLPIADLLAGMFGAFGVTAALKEREATGLGRAVETSLLAAVVGVHAFHGSGWLAAGVPPVRTGNRHPSIAPYGVFPCADASIVVAVGSESLWRRFAVVVGLDPDRPDIARNDDRVRNVHALEAEIGEALSGWKADDMLAELETAGVPAGRIRTLPEVYAWEQVRHLGLVHEVVHPTLGPVSVPGSALRIDGAPAVSPVAPPALGQHESEGAGW